MDTSILLLLLLIHIVRSIPIGVNLGSVRDWSRSLEYVDLIKQSRLWGSPSTPWDGNVTFDPINGWPTNDFGVIIATNHLDIGGTYLLYAKGNADISTIDGLSMYVTKQIYHQENNSLSAVINIPEGQTGIVLCFRNTTGPGLQDLILLQPNYNLSSQFHLTDVMLSHLSRFDLIRFMAWIDTNGNCQVDWNERTSLNWPQYTPPKHNPWETIPMILKQINKSIDIWISIPFHADDDYILNLAQLMFNQINENINIYIEYSNELWNWAFEQSKANLNAANQSVFNDNDRYHFNYDNISNIHTWSYRRTAYQIKRLAYLFKQIFGEENVGPWKRIRPILSGQSSKAHVIFTGLDYLNDNYGSPSLYLHGIAIAPYFTLGIYNHWTNLTTHQILDAYQNSIEKYSPDQGWHEQATIALHATYAAWYNLSVYAYEGGEDSSEGCLLCSIEAKINATHHPRMIDLSFQYLNQWFRFGFQTFNWYVAGAGDIHLLGSWNLLEDMRQEIRFNTTTMFNSTSPVASLPRPSKKLQAIDQIHSNSIQSTFGINIPCINFNATNYMNHSLFSRHSYLTNLTINSTFYYPLRIVQSPIQINITVYVSGNSGLLQGSINNQQFIQIQTPQTFNSTVFQPTTMMSFAIDQRHLPSTATFRLKVIKNGFSVRSFDILSV